MLPVGAQRPVQVNVLVIAATNRSLEAMVDRGTFRRDLFARLAMARIDVPALRDCCEDLFSVASELARRVGSALAEETVEVEAIERLLLESWPGNVSQLDATLAAVRRVDPAPGLRLWALEEVMGAATGIKTALTEEMVEAAIEAEGGNVTAAAGIGISRGKLLRYRKRGK